MRKYNFKSKNYEEYKVPDDWKLAIVGKDFNEIINCASCGRKVKAGSTTPSFKIHNSLGFGYGVCNKCYGKEYKEKMMFGG